MASQFSKRTFDEASCDADEMQENNSDVKYMATMNKSVFHDLYTDVLLEIFQYLRPIDLLYSFTNLSPLVDTLLEPYTHTLDFRLTSKSYFQSLTQSLLPCLTNHLRVLRLSNTYTFSQISELVYKFEWSQIKQLESLFFDSIKPDELSRYFLLIHPLLEHLWRLSLTFDVDTDHLSEKLLLDHILTCQSHSLTNCFLIGITLDLSKCITQKCNKNLRELTITLVSINDLIILFRILPQLEILTCSIMKSTSIDHLDKISPLNSLTILTLIIHQSIEYKNLQTLLGPHTKLKRLSLKAILVNKNSKQDIGGFELEKFFRAFSQLRELHFYLRHQQTSEYFPVNSKPDYLYLFGFTSRYWLDRSIQVCTHFVQRCGQRYIYTLPFAFDTLEIEDEINDFCRGNYQHYYTNVHHLRLLSTLSFDEFTYSKVILAFFPNIKTITFSDKPSSNTTIKILNNHQWIQPKNGSKASELMLVPYVYILNSSKSTHWYWQTLDVLAENPTLFAKNSKRVRQVTIYEMTQQQLINLNYFFPWIHVLTLHIDRSEWFSFAHDWLYQLLMNMTSLLSLTVYYPKDIEVQTIRDLLVNALLNVKKHFYIKCNDGILNVWL